MSGGAGSHAPALAALPDGRVCLLALVDAAGQALVCARGCLSRAGEQNTRLIAHSMVSAVEWLEHVATVRTGVGHSLNQH